jgi:hypothetical protein
MFIRRWLPSGMLICSIWYILTDVSEEYIAYIVRMIADRHGEANMYIFATLVAVMLKNGHVLKD